MLLESKEREIAIMCYCVMKWKVICNNSQNQERKQFAFLERKIENFCAHALRKRKKKAKEKKKQKHTHIEVNTTKRGASRDHALLILLFFENKIHLHNEGGSSTEILPYKITDCFLEV